MNDSVRITSGRLLARNSLINLAGGVATFLVGAATVPVLIRDLGVDRYGVLTLFSMVVGYFAMSDLGLGRAATKLIAETASVRRTDEIPSLFWTSFYMTIALGVFVAVVLAAFVPHLVNLLKIPRILRRESLDVFYLLAFSTPLVISTDGLTGTLSAFQRFDLVNAVNVPTVIFSYLGPLLVLPFSHRLVWLVSMMVVARLGGWLATFMLCIRVIPALRQQPCLARTAAHRMLSFGGWVAASRAVDPIILYCDRLMIAAMVSVAAVAYYSVPLQIAGKLSVLPGALAGVVFAAFSASFAPDRERVAVIFERSTRYLLIALFPTVLVIVAFASEGLTLWLGPSFAAHSTTVLRWLAVASFVNCLAWIALAMIQAAHRPDLIAKLYAAELPPYVVLLWWTLPRYGLIGAAIVYTIRVVADAIILFLIARWLLPLVDSAVRRIAMLTSLLMPALIVSAALHELVARTALVIITLMLFGLGTWAVLLEPQERSFVSAYLRVLLPESLA